MSTPTHNPDHSHDHKATENTDPVKYQAERLLKSGAVDASTTFSQLSGILAEDRANGN